MKTLSRLLGIGCVLLATSAQAKPHKHHNNPGPAATPYPETAPAVDPGALPSVSLQPFLDSHLDRILAPLGQPGMNQPEIVASLKLAYGNGLNAAPAPRKPAYVAAQRVCDVLANALTERQKAEAALQGATSTHSSANVQPRGGRRAGQAEVQDTDAFFVNAQKNDWNRRAGELRRNIAALDQQEHAIEQQLTAASAPTATVMPAAPAAPTPSVSAPAGADR